MTYCKELLRGVKLASPKILDNLGIKVNFAAAIKNHRQSFPLWRRIFWPWLTRKEKTRAVLNATLDAGEAILNG